MNKHELQNKIIKLDATIEQLIFDLKNLNIDSIEDWHKYTSQDLCKSLLKLMPQIQESYEKLSDKIK